MLSFLTVKYINKQINSVPVSTACQPTVKGVLPWMTYPVMGLPLSCPGLHDSWAVLSVTSSTTTRSGGLGGPDSVTSSKEVN